MGQFTVILILFTFQVLMFLYFRMMIRRELSQENRIDSVRREIEQLIIELDRTTDRNIELIEDRIGKLKDSVKNGERIIRLIESETIKRDTSTSLYNDLRSQQRPLSEVIMPQEEIIGVVTPDDKLDIEVIDGKERALELFRQGMEPALISSATGLPRGEVELIISLNRKG